MAMCPLTASKWPTTESYSTGSKQPNSESNWGSGSDRCAFGSDGLVGVPVQGLTKLHGLELAALGLADPAPHEDQREHGEPAVQAVSEGQAHAGQGGERGGDEPVGQPLGGGGHGQRGRPNAVV